MTTADVKDVDLDSVDLADPAVWDDGVPYELFERMQREAPVHFSPQNNAPGEGGFWSITRFDDVRAVSRDHRTFSSEKRGIFHLDDIAEGIPLDLQRLQLISMDPPRHDRLKALVIKEFTPGEDRRARRGTSSRSSAMFSTVSPTKSGSTWSPTWRGPIPARVIGSLLGTPPEDDEKLVHWTNVFTAFEDPAIREQWSDAGAIVTEIIEYVNHQLAARTDTASGSLVNTMLTAEVEGEKLTELEIATFFVLLMSAGNDSTRATYSATMLEMLRNPELRDQLRENPDLIDAAVEEGLRCYPAFAFMARAATKDTELHGKTIKEGDRLLLWYIASNRDESVFENPDKFDITREGLADKHQAFGGRGKHFCLGANLARLELKLWIQQTLGTLPGSRTGR